MHNLSTWRASKQYLEQVFQMWRAAFVRFCPWQKPNFIEGCWLKASNLQPRCSSPMKSACPCNHPKETWHDFRQNSITLLKSHSTTTSKVTKRDLHSVSKYWTRYKKLISQGYDWIQNGYSHISLTLKNSHP